MAPPGTALPGVAPPGMALPGRSVAGGGPGPAMTGGRRAAAARHVAVACWRATASLADRIWYTRPGLLMLAYIALIAAGRLAAHSAGRTSKEAGLEVAAAVLLFWCWRVARGGHLSRLLLLFSTWYAIGFSVAHLATWWDIQDAAVLLISAAQLALLLSPAAYLATRQDTARAFRKTGQWLVPVASGRRRAPWTEPARTALTLRLRPPGWLLLTAAAAGLLITAALLPGVHYAALPHCVPGAPPPGGAALNRCAGFWHGLPLPVWTVGWRLQPAAWMALVRDCVQWLTVSLAALYAIWLADHCRPTSLPAADAEPAAVPAA